MACRVCWVEVPVTTRRRFKKKEIEGEIAFPSGALTAMLLALTAGACAYTPISPLADAMMRNKHAMAAAKYLLSRTSRSSMQFNGGRDRFQNLDAPDAILALAKTLADRDPAQDRRGVYGKFEPPLVSPFCWIAALLAEAGGLELRVGLVELHDLVAGDRRQILGQDVLSQRVAEGRGDGSVARRPRGPRRRRGRGRRALGDDLERPGARFERVAHNAFSAAFKDPRFPPLQAAELSNLTLQISVLSAPVEVTFSGEQDLLQQLVPQQDGLILQEGQRRATFLPQVWEQLPQPAQFVQQLKAKAGLPQNYWSPRLRVQRYRVQKFI